MIADKLAVSKAKIDKVVRIGTKATYDGRHYSIFCHIQFNDGKLSISGVEGPTPNGNAVGSCGQIDTHLRGENDPTFAPGWDAAMYRKFLAVWDRWHLNDMRAGCEHQRAAGWDKLPIDPDKPLNAYGCFHPKQSQSQASWNMVTWLPSNKFDCGLMCEPCAVCGYKYGTAWLHEDVPMDVLEFLESLPQADREPAWV